MPFISRHLSCGLLLDFLGLCLLQLSDAGLTLVRDNTTTPVLSDLIKAVVVVRLNGIGDLCQGTTILRVDVSQTEGSTCLALTECAKTSLALHNAVWNTHSSAESGQVEYQLNGINIMSNDDKLCLLGFNEGGDGVHTLADGQCPLGRLIGLSFSLLGGTSPKPLLLRLLGFRAILVQEREQVDGSLPIQGLRELVDWWRNLDTAVKDGLLPLEANVFGPTDETAQITTWLDVLTDREVLGSLFKEWVGRLLFDGLLLAAQWCWRHLLTLALSFWGHFNLC